MVWFRVDDGWHSHPKTADVSFEARGLWVTAGSWCSQHLTDGAVPTKMLKLWGAKPKLAAELVRSGLWEETETGFLFHDWSALNPRREDVLGKRAADANRKRESRGSPHPVRADTPRSPNGLTPDSEANNSGVTADVRAESSRARPRPDPSGSHPVPSRPDPTASAPRSTAHGDDSVWSALEQQNPRISTLEVAQAVSHEIRAITGKHWDPMVQSHREHLCWIAHQPLGEWERVQSALRADPWVHDNPASVTPNHIRGQWPKYADGPRAKQPRKGAPIPVSSANDFASGGDDFEQLMSAKEASGG